MMPNLRKLKRQLNSHKIMKEATDFTGGLLVDECNHPHFFLNCVRKMKSVWKRKGHGTRHFDTEDTEDTDFRSTPLLYCILHVEVIKQYLWWLLLHLYFELKYVYTIKTTSFVLFFMVEVDKKNKNWKCVISTLHYSVSKTT